jgi:PilZ domain
VRFRIGDAMIVARVSDISVGGMFVKAKKHIPVGAFLEMTLVRPGHEEISLGGVVVDDVSRREGLAIRFEGQSDVARRAIARIMEDVRGNEPAPYVEYKTEPVRPARNARNSGALPAPSVTTDTVAMAVVDARPRDADLEVLRKRVATLVTENSALRAELKRSEEAEKLVGKLQLEIERLRNRPDAPGAVDPGVLADMRRETEAAWTAIARVSDRLDKLDRRG